MTGGSALRFVPDGERDAGQVRRWRGDFGLHAVLAPLMGTQPVFARLLRDALAHARQGAAGFWLPQAYALRRFGTHLDLTVPASAVGALLLDGVDVAGPRVAHPSPAAPKVSTQRPRAAPRGRLFHTGHWFIGAGDWSPILLPFARHQVSREAEELAAADLRFRDTPVYARYRRRAEAGKPMVRNRLVLDTPAAVDVYFEGFVALFESIREHGLRRRAEFAGRRGWRAGRRRWLAELGEQDIGVALAAQGRLVKLPGGQHRFAIARALGLEAVPVQVRMLHVGALGDMSAAALAGAIDAHGVCGLYNVGTAEDGRIIRAS
jgi:hypothetical protein